MSDPKSKVNVEIVETKEEPVDLERLIKPTEVKLDLSFGTFTVRDLRMMDVVVLISKCADILNIVSGALSESKVEFSELTTQDLIEIIAMVPNVRERLAFFLAICCGSEKSAFLFEDPTDEDLDKIMSAVLEVVDFERLKNTFLESKLLKKIQALQASSAAQSQSQA